MKAVITGTIDTAFVDELLRQVTTALGIGHVAPPESVHALLGEAQRRSLRMIAGKVLMDQNAPDGVRDGTAKPDRHRGADPAWHGLAGYAITPRLCLAAAALQLQAPGTGGPLPDVGSNAWRKTSMKSPAQARPSAASSYLIAVRTVCHAPRGMPTVFISTTTTS
jgi:hypothetical protein